MRVGVEIGKMVGGEECEVFKKKKIIIIIIIIKKKKKKNNNNNKIKKARVCGLWGGGWG